MRTERTLVLDVSRHDAPVGTSIAIRVRDRSNRSVEGATVAIGTQRKRTDARGRCEFTVRSPGFWKVSAIKPPSDRISYRPATKLLRVLPRPKPSRPRLATTTG
ncbi:carboxypeptidase regulatory-like domain-containing protein [Natrarchaeobius oligotrophus]|uniref:Carboxypeptidase regulatory-like domain-containing protein n=1 Tax=Natrarchaeobius chitinivorans TaxID=1679083 RepID=A0A3N6MG08_NATCH|nr:carboxypeptidase regulatory-like domain-containing protein [Natrarchaeobius chitinivorans]RQG95700.1 carboxypeptidase regulatory-like domain-containing protein [Natrarchaeobius chitinivorans]